MMLLKVAILRNWAQLFAPRGAINTAFSRACYAMLGINVAYYIAAILVTSLACSPHEGIWDRTIPGKCLDSRVILISSASVNVISDIFILLLPQKIIWGLRISAKKRLGISIVFATGLQ